jgi:hypothetical protein
MKQITYLGQTFNAPDESKYVAADSDGRVWAYVDMPRWFDGYYAATTLGFLLGHLNSDSLPVVEI